MKYTLRHVPIIEAMQLPLDPDEDDGQAVEEFIAWAERWNFEYLSDYDNGICFRRKQTMDRNDWVHVNPGDYVTAGGFDFYVDTAEEFEQIYKPA